MTLGARKTLAVIFCLSNVIVLIFVLYAEKEEKGVLPHGTDCTDIKSLHPKTCSGVYNIQPAGIKFKLKVYCEMLPDGGWTVFQRRSGPAVSFGRKWSPGIAEVPKVKVVTAPEKYDWIRSLFTVMTSDLLSDMEDALLELFIDRT